MFSGAHLHLACVMLIAASVGCQRAAPTPEQCSLLAARWHGVPVGHSSGLSEESMAAARLVMVRCITEPFEKEFVRCVIRRGDSRHCVKPFKSPS